MMCDICGMHDIWTEVNAFNLFEKFLKCIDKLHNEEFHVELWKKKVQINLQK